MQYTMYIYTNREHYELYANNDRKNAVECGDFEARYFDEIVAGRNIVLISVRDSGDTEEIKEICRNNNIEYVNVAG